MSRPSLPSTPLPGTPTLRVPSPARTPSPLPLFSGGGPYSYSGQITRKYAARFSEINKTRNIVKEVDKAWEKAAKEKGMDMETLAKSQEKEYIWEEKTTTRLGLVMPDDDTSSVKGDRAEVVEPGKTLELKSNRLSRLSLEEDQFVDALTSPISEKPKDWPDLSPSDNT
jgi:hypothetical protein